MFPHAATMQILLDTQLRQAIRSWRAHLSSAQRYRFDYDHVLGTSLELQLVASSRAAASRAESEVLAEVDRLESILSGWSGTSELARWLTTHDVDAPISAELADVLEASAAWRERTGNAFDPAAQAIIDSLRDRDVDGGNDPTPAPDMESLLAGRRAPLWSVDRAALTARRLTRHTVSLDAIAKGYIVTRAAARARDVAGVTDVLLNIGGDIQHFGTRPVAIGIANPAAPAENAPPVATVRIANAAIATSGGYRRGFVAKGRRVSHIVDPRSGRSASRIASASVFAPDCATADALSTAFSVMEPRESVRLADTLAGVGCLVVTSDGAVLTNATWDAHAVPSPDKTNQ